MRLVLLTAIVIFATAGSALAQLPKKNDGDPNVFCLESSGVEVELKTTGAYVPGAVIGIRADPLRMWAKTPATATSKVCKTTLKDVPQGNWSWQIVERPANSTSQLDSTSGTTVGLFLDRPGVYKIRFLACAFGCEVTVPNYGTVSADPNGAEIVVRVLAIFPPEDIYPQLLFVDQKPSDTSIRSVSLTDHRTFKFSFLPAGRYCLGFNLRGGPSIITPPYPEFYYSGVADRSKATLITLSEGQPISDAYLPRPLRPAERMIEGVAVWPDGLMLSIVASHSPILEQTRARATAYPRMPKDASRSKPSKAKRITSLPRLPIHKDI